VLYEGVETQAQLDICVSSKGRYFQGFLIADPQASMRDAVVNQSLLSESIETAYIAIQKKTINTESLKNSLDAQVVRFLLESPFTLEKTSNDPYLLKLFHELPEVKRIYLCNSKGVQLSNNIERQSGDIVCLDYKNKHWAWRGYFHESIKAFARGRKSCLSNEYRDFTTKEKLCTYCFAINDDVFLFADIIKEQERMDDNAAG